ncbi:unnamed protein product [Calicophoron daubneyi]|uniref:GATOR complex protein NPRL3 n=1 Tax=Calicophoron daubneyi TaxID=300641 RepID=A0AAV2T0T6_CALDB
MEYISLLPVQVAIVSFFGNQRLTYCVIPVRRRKVCLNHIGREHSPLEADNSDGCSRLADETESGPNVFSLNLISDRPPYCEDALTGRLSLSAFGNPYSSATDRLGGVACTGTPANISSGPVNISTSVPSGAASAIASSAPPGSADSISVTAPEGNTERNDGGLSNIEGFPAELVLSLLHQQTHKLQRKIYVKIDDRIFVGAAFNLMPSSNEIGDIGTDPKTDNHSLISFAVFFAMEASVPPSVLSHYTELARLVGAQIRRAELVFNYLSEQRHLIASVVDQTSPGISFGENTATSDRTDPRSGRIEQDFPVTTKTYQMGKPPQRATFAGAHSDNLCAPGGPEHTVLHPCSAKPSNQHEVSDKNSPSCTRPKIETLQDKLVRISSLCRELRDVIDSVYLTGHVSVQINQVYPVFFSLPHKAYCLLREPSDPTPAIRPTAVWRAMDKIRPYHALLLIPRKEDLLKHYLPPDINATMIDFVNDLSPTISLTTLFGRVRSELHCMSLALWLIYRGHALIVYPIVANNTYVLTPHSAAWFGSHLIAQFARMFPTLNLAEVLSSFSTGLTLKDHLKPEIYGNAVANNSVSKPPIVINGQVIAANQLDDVDSSWDSLPYNTKVDLIAWLLRRRLIVQVHLFVFSVFPIVDMESKSKDESVRPRFGNTLYDLLKRSTVDVAALKSGTNGSASDEAPPDKISLDPDALETQVTLPVEQTEVIFPQLPEDLNTELQNAFPQAVRQRCIQSILTHPGSTQDLSLLRLFIHILPHLPAHLEELMFSCSTNRETLIECVERFTPLLLTARLPDSVTACFAGIDWPD